jgi:phage repressor protein C with HTH and peptisase S24 domain
VVLFEPLEDSDFREADGSAAAEGEADARTGVRLWRWGAGSSGERRLGLPEADLVSPVWAAVVAAEKDASEAIQRMASV